MEGCRIGDSKVYKDGWISSHKETISPFKSHITMLLNYMKPVVAQRLAALGYLSVGLGLPFMMPLKHSMEAKKNESTAHGHYSGKTAFRI